MSGRRRAHAGRTWARLSIVILLAAAVWGAYERGGVAPSARAPALEPGVDAIAEAARAGRSDVLVEAAGVVHRVLPDDRDGSRHQRLLVRLPNDQTVLVAHNIDLAPRVAGVQRGDPIRFRGEYEWNENGGVVHWTHRDPAGRHPGGWLEHAGRRYD